MLGVSDNGFVSQYWYDAAGERTVKESFDNEGVYVNGALSGARTGTSKFTAYVSPYMIVSQGGNYTKHVYMGSQRITSKVSNSGIFTTSPVKDTLQSKYAVLTSAIKERFDSLGVTYKGTSQTGGLVSASPAITADSYFYHSDHLGSSSLITNGSGDLVQHIQYVPFGEVFVEERNAKWSTPYKFNGKEQDEETGLCYYGARYYDPRTSVWLSVDPLAEKYPNISSYVYCAGNPVNAIDPDGAVVIFINGQHGGDGGTQKYWNGLDQRIANRFNDYHARYYDGAMGGWANTAITVGASIATRCIAPMRLSNLIPGNRYRAGRAMGYSQAKDIYDNLTKGETIKIATHSMGGAYGKGFVKGLMKYAKEHGLDPRIERVLDLATFQGTSLKTENGIQNEQIAHTNDGVAGVSRIQGVSDGNFNETRQNQDTGGLNEHSVDSFTTSEIDRNVNLGSPSTAQPKPQNGKIIIDYQQNK